MKKTIALTIMAVFIFSLIPLSYAQNSGPGSLGQVRDSVEDVKEDVKDLREDARDKANIDRLKCIEKCRQENGQNCEARCKVVDIRENVKDIREDIKDRRENIREMLKKGKPAMVRNAAELNVRIVSEEKKKEAREMYELAKERYKEAKDQLKDEKDRLREAQQKKDKNATLEHAKQYLLRASDAMINHLEKLKSKVQENENIPDDQEAQIVAEIDAQIAEVNSIKAEIEAATTREQIKEIAKKLRNKWNRLKHLIKFHTYRIVSARVMGIVNFGLVLEKRLDKILARLDESNIDVNVDAEINDFKAKIALSRDKYKQAQAKITEALDLRAAGEPADSESIKTLMEEARVLLKEATDALKQAHDVLKTIVKKIKEAAPDTDLSAEVEVEVEQEETVSTPEPETAETNTSSTASSETSAITDSSTETSTGTGAVVDAQSSTTTGT